MRSGQGVAFDLGAEGGREDLVGPGAGDTSEEGGIDIDIAFCECIENDFGDGGVFVVREPGEDGVGGNFRGGCGWEGEEPS